MTNGVGAALIVATPIEAYYNTALGITWLADTTFIQTSGQGIEIPAES